MHCEEVLRGAFEVRCVRASGGSLSRGVQIMAGWLVAYECVSGKLWTSLHDKRRDFRCLSVSIGRLMFLNPRVMFW